MENELLQQLYLKYQKEIYLYLFSLCRNQEFAEDLMQETFLKALLSLSDKHTNMRPGYIWWLEIFSLIIETENRGIYLWRKSEIRYMMKIHQNY